MGFFTSPLRIIMILAGVFEFVNFFLILQKFDGGKVVPWSAIFPTAGVGDSWLITSPVDSSIATFTLYLFLLFILVLGVVRIIFALHTSLVAVYLFNTLVHMFEWLFLLSTFGAFHPIGRAIGQHIINGTCSLQHVAATFSKLFESEREEDKIFLGLFSIISWWCVWLLLSFRSYTRAAPSSGAASSKKNN